MPFIKRAALLAWLIFGLGTVEAQAPARLVDIIDIDEHDSQVDISLQFTCSLRYAGHSPASEGPEVQLRLRPDRDCGISAAGVGGLASEIPPISGPRGILSGARLESSLGGEVTLTLTFSKPESFVLAQGASPTGMRIRLIRARADKPHILITDSGDVANNFAVNLESQHEPFDPDAVQLAGERLQTKTFVSEIDAGGERWYRLRAGPFDQRSVAESVLRAAAKDYPRAWLAVGDDSITTDPGAAVSEPPLPPVEPMGADPAMNPADRARLLEEARKAFRARQYPSATEMFTKLQRQPEFPERSAVQELLGLSRERAGQMAQAKAEYEEYLRRYPKGPAAERVRTRLRILRAATATSRRGGFDSSGEQGRGWNISGGVTQLYRRDTFAYSPAAASVVENAIFTDADVFARRIGDRVDFSFRLNGGMEQNFLPRHATAVGEPNPDNRVRITTAVFDLNDKLTGLRTRIGRQTATTDGLFGTFDGLMLQYSVQPGWTVRATVGSPVLNAQDDLDTGRRFETLALDYGPELAHWSSSVYVTQQTVDGLRDRQAVGTQWQYFVPGRSLVSYVDYDTQYHSLNAAVLLGTVQLPDRWQLTVDLERRNAPLLATENALLGQVGITTVTQLQQLYSQQQIDQLAKDRTPLLSSYIVSALKQLGERFQVMLDLFVTRESAGPGVLGATPATGGVEAFPGTDGTDVAYQVQLFGTGLLSNADFHQLALRYDHDAQANTTGVDYIARYPLWSSWRIGPRILVQRKVNDTGPVQYSYDPYAHADWQRNGRMVEIEAGTEIGRNPQVLQIGNTTRLFVSIGYRVNF